MSKSRFAVYIWLGILVVVIILLQSYFTQKKVPIRVALPWLNQAQFAGMYVASSKGFYEKEGITTHFIELDFNNPSPIGMLVEGKADVAVVSASHFFSAASRGEEIVALASVFQVSPTVIASLESSNIKSPKDLEGKKIGMPVASEQSKLAIYALLEEVKIPEDSVVFSEVGYNQVESLLSGDVDAVSIFRTNELYDLDKNGVKYSVLFPERFGVDMYGDIIVVRKDYLESHEKEIGGFLRATFKGWSFAEREPQEAVRITLEVDNPKYHDEKREEYILNSALQMIRMYPKQTLGQMVPSHWHYMYELFQSHGLVSELDLDKFFIDPLAYRRLGFPEY